MGPLLVQGLALASEFRALVLFEKTLTETLNTKPSIPPPGTLHGGILVHTSCLRFVKREP